MFKTFKVCKIYQSQSDWYFRGRIFIIYSQQREGVLTEDLPIPSCNFNLTSRKSTKVDWKTEELCANLHANCYNSIMGYKIANKKLVTRPKLLRAIFSKVKIYSYIVIVIVTIVIVIVVPCPLKVASGWPPCRTTGISKTREKRRLSKGHLTYYPVKNVCTIDTPAQRDKFSLTNIPRFSHVFIRWR